MMEISDSSREHFLIPDQGASGFMRCLSIFRIWAGFIPVLLCVTLSFGADDKQIAEKAREIEDNLIAPCCWSQPVSQHYSEVAEQIRKEVREMVAAGKSRDEILDYYVAKYGERILAAPPAKGFSSLAYILPWGALMVGAWLLVLLIKKLRSPAPSPTPASLPDARYASVIEKEIKELED
jgi:cytochrome c-type biogenesis protein CcmH